MRSGSQRRAVRVFTVALVGVALAAGCSRGADPEPLPWPLTGLAGFSADAGQVVTVKVDNTSSGRPQVGLDKADLVVQEMVEGGVTRLAAMYQSQRPTEVGPVRSLRETDIGLVLPTGGTLAASGGAADTVAAVTGAGIPIAVEGAPGFSRSSDRSAPYNLMLDVAELSGTLPDSPVPAPYFTFGDLGSVVEEAPHQTATSATLTWPNAHSTFAYDATTAAWRLTDPATAAGDFISVVAVFLPVTFAGKDASGTPIPTMHMEGQGRGVVFAQGMRFDVTWSKSGPSSPWTFHYPAGTTDHELTLAPGRTFLALLPEDDGKVSD